MGSADYGGGMCNPIQLSARLRDELEKVPTIEPEPSDTPIEPQADEPVVEEVLSHA
jgi:hypothetical protein